MTEHGQYSVDLEQNILSITLIGMFNDIATKSVCELIKALVVSLENKPFKILLDCSAYEGSTREAHQVSNQHLLWLNKQNCIARATVFNQKLYHDIVKNEQPALFELQNRREFNNIAEAKRWLEQLTVVD